MKKRIFLLLLIVPVFLAGCTTQKSTLANLSDIKLESGQQLITGQVKSIQGNEIVMDVGTYRAAQRTTTGGDASSQPGASASRGANAARSAGGSAGNFGGGSSGTARASGAPGSSASAGNFSLSPSTSASDSYVSGTSYAGQRLGSNHSVTFTDPNGNQVNGNGAAGRFGSFGGGQMPGGLGGDAYPSGGQGGAMPSGGRQSGGSYGNAGGNGSGRGNSANSGNSSGSTNSGARASGAAGSAGASGSGEYRNGTSGANGFAAGASGFSASRFQSSGQTMNLTIPVGTTVLTTSGGALSTTTFGKILADDIIELIVQTDSSGAQTVIEAQIMG